MELKYLQIYRAISNFATSIVGAFIPLIIFQYTGNMIYSVLYIVLYRLMGVVLNYVFKKITFSKPQIMLMYRIIPIIIFEVLTIFVDRSPIIICSIMGVAYSFDYALNMLPNEMIFSFNNTDDDASTLGVTRIIEQIGYVVAMFMGALVLDYIPVYYLIIMSISLYLISVIPLLKFYNQNKGKQFYNKELVSNAVAYADHVNDSRCDKLRTKVVRKYGLNYMFIQAIDVFYILLPLVVYVFYGKYVYAGILIGIYDIVLLFMCLILGKLDEKYDLSVVNSVSCVLSGVLSIGFIVLLPFTHLFWLECIIVALVSITAAVPYIFTQSRLFMKTRVLGCQGEGLFAIYNSLSASDIVYESFAFFLPIYAPVLITSVVLIANSVVSPVIEESTRKDIVDFVSQNEITDDHDLQVKEDEKIT